MGAGERDRGPPTSKLGLSHQPRGEKPPTEGATTVTAIITILTAALFLAAGGMKLAGLPMSLESRDHFGIDPGRWRLIGLLEVAGAVGALIGLALRPLGIAALIGLVMTSIGAIATHRRAADPPSDTAPAAVALILSTAALVLQITD